MNTQPKSVFIVGTAYSGSSMLGMALNNNNFGITYVGELSRVPSFRSKYKLDLTDGQCSACQISGNENPKEAHKYLARLLNAKTIIDSSKHVSWLRLFLDAKSNSDIRVLISVKNPRDYVQSCLDRSIGEPWQAANAWRDTYFDALRTLSRANVAYLVVRNEDLVKNRDQTLLNVQSFLSLPYKNPKQSKVIHAIGGNPAARTNEFGAKQIRSVVKRLDRVVYDLNPVKKTPTSKQKITFDTQILFDTPGLSDLANMLGYSAKDLI
jgi:hypothetical protein